MPVIFLQPDGVAISAGDHRRGRAALYGGGANRAVGGRSGFRVDTPSNVLTVSATAWSLRACAAMIDPGASTNQGMYGWATDSTVTGTPTPPDANLPRKDIYYIQINDSSAGDGTSGTPNANVYYLAGTPAASPVAPDLPPRSLLIGTATVPQVGAGAPTVTLNTARFVAAGGIQPVWSQAEFDALVPFEGFTVRRMDLSRTPTWVYRSGAWGSDTPGIVGYVSDGTTSTGLAGSGIMCNSVTVDLAAGRRYRATYRFAARSPEASLGIIASIRTSTAGDTSSAGTVIPFDQTIYTSPRTSSWGAQKVEVTWLQGSNATLAVKAILARLVGTEAYDIADRVLYVEDLGAV